MATGALHSLGTLFKLESGASVGTFNTIPENRKCTAPSVEFDLLDASNHDSSAGFREYVPGFADGKNATLEINFIPQNALHIQLRTDSYAKTKKNFQVIFPGGGTGAQMAFAGYILGLSPKADAAQILLEDVNVKMTGAPTWT